MHHYLNIDHFHFWWHVEATYAAAHLHAYFMCVWYVYMLWAPLYVRMWPTHPQKKRKKTYVPPVSPPSLSQPPPIISQHKNLIMMPLSGLVSNLFFREALQSIEIMHAHLYELGNWEGQIEYNSNNNSNNNKPLLSIISIVQSDGIFFSL